MAITKKTEVLLEVMCEEEIDVLNEALFWFRVALREADDNNGAPFKEDEELWGWDETATILMDRLEVLGAQSNATTMTKIAKCMLHGGRKRRIVADLRKRRLDVRKEIEEEEE
jgi:hypothetical protein